MRFLARATHAGPDIGSAALLLGCEISTVSVGCSGCRRTWAEAVRACRLLTRRCASHRAQDAEQPRVGAALAAAQAGAPQQAGGGGGWRCEGRVGKLSAAGRPSTAYEWACSSCALGHFRSRSSSALLLTPPTAHQTATRPQRQRLEEEQRGVSERMSSLERRNHALEEENRRLREDTERLHDELRFLRSQVRCHMAARPVGRKRARVCCPGRGAASRPANLFGGSRPGSRSSLDARASLLGWTPLCSSPASPSAMALAATRTTTPTAAAAGTAQAGAHAACRRRRRTATTRRRRCRPSGTACRTRAAARSTPRVRPGAAWYGWAGRRPSWHPARCSLSCTMFPPRVLRVWASAAEWGSSKRHSCADMLCSAFHPCSRRARQRGSGQAAAQWRSQRLGRAGQAHTDRRTAYRCRAGAGLERQGDCAGTGQGPASVSRCCTRRRWRRRCGRVSLRQPWPRRGCGHVYLPDALCTGPPRAHEGEGCSAPKPQRHGDAVSRLVPDAAAVALELASDAAAALSKIWAGGVVGDQATQRCGPHGRPRGQDCVARPHERGFGQGGQLWRG